MEKNIEIIVIGIDMGSSSVKVGAYRRLANWSCQILEVTTEKYPKDAFETLESHGYHQMNLSLVLETVQNCLNRINYNYRYRAKKLAICGQMHGIIFWKEGSKGNSNADEDYYPWRYDPVNGTFIINHKRFSSYVTWQDSRCSQSFLDKLMVDNYMILGDQIKTAPSDHDSPNHPHQGGICCQLSSGFGLTTGLWFVCNDKQYLNRFNRCGTPMTVLLRMLLTTNADTKNQTESLKLHYGISDQIAASWGFYDLESSSWLLQSLRRLEFPASQTDEHSDEQQQQHHIELPRIFKAGTCMGSSGAYWMHLPRGIQLYVECGDMQSSARVCLNHRSKAAVMNISTSIQLAIPIDKLPTAEFMQTHQGLTVLPYIAGQYLLVAASLNGGRVLQRFVEFLHDVANKLGGTTKSATGQENSTPPISLDHVWNHLSTSYDDHLGSQSMSLNIKPTIFGERHDPTLTGSINNIRSDNLTMNNIMSSLCHGILMNVLTMMPEEVLAANDIQQVICVGNVMQKSPTMRSIIEATFKRMNIRVNFLMAADAQEGAAINALDAD